MGSVSDMFENHAKRKADELTQEQDPKRKCHIRSPERTATPAPWWHLSQTSSHDLFMFNAADTIASLRSASVACILYIHPARLRGLFTTSTNCLVLFVQTLSPALSSALTKVRAKSHSLMQSSLSSTSVRVKVVPSSFLSILLMQADGQLPVLRGHNGLPINGTHSLAGSNSMQTVQLGFGDKLVAFKKRCEDKKKNILNKANPLQLRMLFDLQQTNTPFPRVPNSVMLCRTYAAICKVPMSGSGAAPDMLNSKLYGSQLMGTLPGTHMLTEYM